MRAKLILMLMLAGLTAFAQSPNDYVVMRAWEHVRRADACVYPSGLVAYLSMDSRSGTTVYDTFGSNDGESFSASFEATPPNVNGDYASFDGINRVVVPNDNSLRFGSGDFSILFWGQINHSAVVFLSKDYRNYEVYTYLSRVGFYVGGTAGAILVDSAHAFTQDVWYHIAAVKQSSVVYLYINGVLRKQGANTGSTDTNTADLWIGERSPSGGSGNACKVDEIAIFDRALTSNEVSEIYNDGVGRFYTP